MDNNKDNIKSSIEDMFGKQETTKQETPEFSFRSDQDVEPEEAKDGNSGFNIRSVLQKLMNELLEKMPLTSSFCSDIPDDWFTTGRLKVELPTGDKELSMTQQLKVMCYMTFYTGLLAFMAELTSDDEALQVHHSVKKKYDLMLDYILYHRNANDSDGMIFSFIENEWQVGLDQLGYDHDHMAFVGSMTNAYIRGFGFTFRPLLNLSPRKKEG